jgi:hypothetical protein
MMQSSPWDHLAMSEDPTSALHHVTFGQVRRFMHATAHLTEKQKGDLADLLEASFPEMPSEEAILAVLDN